MKLFLFDKTENTFVRIVKNIVVYSFIFSSLFMILTVIFTSLKMPFYVFLVLSSFSFCCSIGVLIVCSFIWVVKESFNEIKTNRSEKRFKKDQEQLRIKTESATFLLKTEYSGYNDNANYQYWELREYFLTDEGEIIIKEKSSQYDVYNIIRGWTSEIFHKITFEKFNDIINKYNIEDGKKYLGLSKDNYTTYLKKGNESITTAQHVEHHGPAWYEEQKVKNFEHVLTLETDGYKATALYVHKLTNKPYIVYKTLEQYGAGYYDMYHKIDLSTYEIINKMLSEMTNEKFKKYIGINENNWTAYLDN